MREPRGRGELEFEMEKVAVRELTSRGLRSDSEMVRSKNEDGCTFVTSPNACEASPTANGEDRRATLISHPTS